MTLLHLVNIALLFIMAAPATSFPLLYLRSNWRQTPAGRAIMVSTSALALLIDVSVAGQFLHNINPLIGGLITLGVFLVILTGIIYKLVTLLKTQREQGMWQCNKDWLKRLKFWRKK